MARTAKCFIAALCYTSLGAASHSETASAAQVLAPLNDTSEVELITGDQGESAELESLSLLPSLEDVSTEEELSSDIEVSEMGRRLKNTIDSHDSGEEVIEGLAFDKLFQGRSNSLLSSRPNQNALRPAVNNILSDADGFMSNMANSQNLDLYTNSGSRDYYPSNTQYNPGSSGPPLGNYISNVVDNSVLGEYIPPGVTDALYKGIYHSDGLGQTLAPFVGDGPAQFLDNAHQLLTEPYQQYGNNYSSNSYRNNYNRNQGGNYSGQRSRGGSHSNGSSRNSQKCCADCQSGNISCLSSCVIEGCNTTSTCDAAGDGAYAAFCQERCNVIGGMSFRKQQYLPERACAGQCASKVQRKCRDKACREYGCTVHDCGAVAPARCER